LYDSQYGRPSDVFRFSLNPFRQQSHPTKWPDEIWSENSQDKFQSNSNPFGKLFGNCTIHVSIEYESFREQNIYGKEARGSMSPLNPNPFGDWRRSESQLNESRPDNFLGISNSSANLQHLTKGANEFHSDNPFRKQLQGQQEYVHETLVYNSSNPFQQHVTSLSQELQPHNPTSVSTEVFELPAIWQDFPQNDTTINVSERSIVNEDPA
jgi:hypothetical protein